MCHRCLFVFPMAEEKIVDFPGKDASLSRNEKKKYLVWTKRICLFWADLIWNYMRSGDINLYIIVDYSWCFGGGFSVAFRPMFEIALNHFIPIPAVNFFLGVLFCLTFHYAIMFYPLLNSYWYHYRIFFRSMGPKGKFMTDLIPALTAAVLCLNLLALCL